VNNFRDRIERNLTRGKPLTGREIFTQTLFILSKEANMPPSDVVKMPSPLVFDLLEELSKHAKKQEKALKKKK